MDHLSYPRLLRVDCLSHPRLLRVDHPSPLRVDRLSDPRLLRVDHPSLLQVDRLSDPRLLRVDRLSYLCPLLFDCISHPLSPSTLHTVNHLSLLYYINTCCTCKHVFHLTCTCKGALRGGRGALLILRPPPPPLGCVGISKNHKIGTYISHCTNKPNCVCGLRSHQKQSQRL